MYVYASSGGWQHGCSSQQILCHCACPKTQTRGHPGFGLYGARAAHPVLQVNPLQADQDHFLQRWSFRRPVQTGLLLLFSRQLNNLGFFSPVGPSEGGLLLIVSSSILDLFYFFFIFNARVRLTCTDTLGSSVFN